MANRTRKARPRPLITQTEIDRRELRLRAVSIVLLCSLVLLIGILIVVNTGEDSGKEMLAQADPGTTEANAAKQAADNASNSDIESVKVPPLDVYRRRNVFRPLVDMNAGQVATDLSAGAGPVAFITVPEELSSPSAAGGSIVAVSAVLNKVSTNAERSIASITIGDQLYDDIAVGDRFGGSYKLVSVSCDSTATILFGDERITLITGQPVFL